MAKPARKKKRIAPVRHQYRPAKLSKPPVVSRPPVIFQSESVSPAPPPALPVLSVPLPSAPAPQALVGRPLTVLAVILSLLVPGLGHWIVLHSRHAPGYLLMAFLAWFIALSAVTACWWDCQFIFGLPILSVFILPLAMHLIAAYDVKQECEGKAGKRILGHVF